MQGYMRYQFSFIGISTANLRSLCKKVFKHAQKTEEIDWNFIDACWENNDRELQYVAVNYLVAMKKRLLPEHLSRIRSLATAKSWWDTVDGLFPLAGDLTLRYPHLETTLLEWSLHSNIWLRRIAICHQILRKDQTNTELLNHILLNNFGSKEFFVNKAIGWSLQDYSKTNPEWVRQFLESHHTTMAPLSLRETRKYL